MPFPIEWNQANGFSNPSGWEIVKSCSWTDTSTRYFQSSHKDTCTERVERIGHHKDSLAKPLFFKDTLAKGQVFKSSTRAILDENGVFRNPVFHQVYSHSYCLSDQFIWPLATRNNQLWSFLELLINGLSLLKTLGQEWGNLVSDQTWAKDDDGVWLFANRKEIAKGPIGYIRELEKGHVKQGKVSQINEDVISWEIG